VSIAYAAANRFKTRMSRSREVSTGAAVAVVLGFVLLVVIALGFAVLPPTLAALLWFPALGLTGWPLVAASVGGFLAWGAFLHLLRLRRK
jgi:hypothetical protein